MYQRGRQNKRACLFFFFSFLFSSFSLFFSFLFLDEMAWKNKGRRERVLFVEGRRWELSDDLVTWPVDWNTEQEKEKKKKRKEKKSTTGPARDDMARTKKTK